MNKLSAWLNLEMCAQPWVNWNIPSSLHPQENKQANKQTNQIKPKENPQKNKTKK